MVTPHAPPTSAIAGIAICGNCQARFRVQQKHLALVGKTIRCPKCHQQFVLKVEKPTPIETAAIKIAEQPGKAKRKKRTKLQILRHRLSSIKKAMRPYHARLTQLASQDKCSEEQVRVWCIDVLRNVLGYKDIEIDTEMYALNQRIDIAIKRDDKVFMVIECKNTRSKLPASAVNQAVTYAASKSADWAVIPRGHVRNLGPVVPATAPDPRPAAVSDFRPLPPDGCSDADVANLYLLTSRALFKGETEKCHHQVACMSNPSMLSAITTPRVVKALRRSLIEAYLKTSKVRVRISEEEMEERIREMFLPADLSDPPSGANANGSAD